MELTDAEQQLMNDGAQLERDAMRRMLKRKYEDEQDWLSVEALKAWLDRRVKAYRKAGGGLGNK